MLLHIDLGNRRQLVRQIHARIRAAALDGTLRAGERLPSSRDLARQLAVSRNTVAAAYDWLLADGLIEGRAGAGSFVRDLGGTGAAAATRPRAIPPLQPFYRNAGAASDRSQAPARYAFAVGVPDGAAFPYVLWRRAMTRQMKRGMLDHTLGEAAGSARLREAIARHVAAARGVRATAGDVVATNGAQQGFALLADVLVASGARVAVEEPGYRPLRLAFASRGAEVVGVPVDAEGIVVSALPRDARVVCVTPSHQFPLGMTMSHRRRGDLLAWAERTNAIVVEDDYDSEFRFDGPPISALHSLDRSGRVVYVGSFSKTMLPTLRLGFLVAPPTLRAALCRARAVADLRGNEQMQMALADFLDSGNLARHIRRVRRLYGGRHELIVRSLRDELSPWLQPGPSAIGLHLVARLRRQSLALEAAIVTEARRQDVAVTALSAYFAGKRRQSGLVLGYGATAMADLPEALRRLRAAIEAVA